MNGVLPLPGSLPDMRARSADYIKLQNTYKAKARSDVEEVLSIVRKLEEQLDRKPQIPEKEVEEFCKNSASVKLIRGRQQRSIKSGDIDWAGQAKAAGRDEPSLLIFCFIFLLVMIFLMQSFS